MTDLLGAERDVLAVLEREGPLTGAELADRTRLDALPLWQACRRSGGIRVAVAGRRYLRLDRAVEGYARLSPSIRREFLTYTVLGLATGTEQTLERAAALEREAARISKAKIELARDTMEQVVSGLPEADAIRAGTCSIIAGDVTYGMAHVVPRPETSTGLMVRGSDLDIVVIATDELAEETLQGLDDAVYRKKHYLLVHPASREEIDYVVKRLAKVREQLAFDNLRAMIACKIMWEGQYLAGSAGLFAAVKELVERQGIPVRLAQLEAQATAARAVAEASLLDPDCDAPDDACRHLFYTSEESEEIA